MLWLGLFLCLYALWHSRVLLGEAVSQISATGCVTVVIMLIAGLSLAMMAWRQYLIAYARRDPGWRVAMRQLGLLLVGKYVPGGVFGFMARLYDQPGIPRLPLFWAGLVEQVVGVAMSAALGGILFLAAVRTDMAWLGLVLPLPWLAVAGVWMLHRFAAGLPWLRRHASDSTQPVWPELLSSITMQLAQLVAWAVLVAVLASELFGMDGYAAMGLAGAFLVAVTVGMLAIFAPGGIGVREAALVVLASLWLDTQQAVVLSAILRLLSSVMDACAGGLSVLLGRSGGKETT